MPYKKAVVVSMVFVLVSFVFSPAISSARVFPVAPPVSSGPDVAAKAMVASAMMKLPMMFEENRGQMDKQVKFMSRGHGYALYLAEAGVATLALRNGGKEGSLAVVKMTPVGSREESTPSGIDIQQAKYNYYKGSDPSKWALNVPLYGKVAYNDIYDGIDLVYYGNQRRLEYDFVVAPGADPSVIRLSFDGVQSARINESGDLVLSLTGGEVLLKAPVSYQEKDGKRVKVESRYVAEDDAGLVAFRLGSYDKSTPLVIDPLLSYSTLIGGFSSDYGYGIAVDSSGNMYVTGHTSSTDYPVTDGSTYNGYWDVFVTKLSSAGANPSPDIKANNSDGPVGLALGDNLSVTVELDPGIRLGENADWWVGATSPFGLYWFTLDSGWVRSDAPIRVYGGPLFSFLPFTILNMSTLPVGDYTFYFGVDTSMNGMLDDPLYYDDVVVEVNRIPVNYMPDNFGWRFMSHANYVWNDGSTYYIYHPAADINVEGDNQGDKPVRSIADGEVVAIDNGWGGIVIQHDVNGQNYYSQYGHIYHLSHDNCGGGDDLIAGDLVKRGQQIGCIGDVGSEGVHHLHFEIRSPHHLDATKAGYWGDKGSDIDTKRKVFIGYESPLAFVESYIYPNQTVVIVEDSVTYLNIENDIVDNKVQINGEVIKQRFFKSWNLDDWNTYVGSTGEGRGYEGNYHYATTTSGDSTAAGKWYFDIPETGNYEVLVSIPSQNATTKNAIYELYHNSQTDYHTVDQSVVTGTLDERWVSLGTYSFQQGNDHYVKLSNNTGENNLQIGFDAIKLIKN